MRDCIAIAQALSDERRVRVLMALRGGELCDEQLAAMLRVPVPVAAEHLAILQDAGLLASRSEGRWVYRRLADAAADSPQQGALDWLQASLADDSTVALDAASLCCIVAYDKEDLCRSQVS